MHSWVLVKVCTALDAGLESAVIANWSRRGAVVGSARRPGAGQQLRSVRVPYEMLTPRRHNTAIAAAAEFLSQQLILNSHFHMWLPQTKRRESEFCFSTSIERTCPPMRAPQLRAPLKAWPWPCWPRCHQWCSTRAQQRVKLCNSTLPQGAEVGFKGEPAQALDRREFPRWAGSAKATALQDQELRWNSIAAPDR